MSAKRKDWADAQAEDVVRTWIRGPRQAEPLRVIVARALRAAWRKGWKDRDALPKV